MSELAHHEPEPELRLFIHPETMRKAVQAARLRSKEVGTYLAEMIRTAVHKDHDADRKGRQ